MAQRSKDVEKMPQMAQIERLATVEALPEYAKTEGGVLLDVGANNVHHLKVAKDGHTVLLPQPSEDPGDPLHWSFFKKHMILVTLAYGAFCCDFITQNCTTLIVAQGIEWNMDPNSVQHANNLAILMLGIGALIWVPLSTCWGRAPTIFWTAFAAVFMNLGVALAPDYQTYYVMRVLSGLFSYAPPTIGIAFLRDIFFLHERARKIGLWTCLFTISPYVGSLCAYFMLSGLGQWRPVLWLDFAVQASYFITLIFFLDETWYRRDIHSGGQLQRRSGFGNRMLRVTGIWQIKHHRGYFLSVRHSVTRFFMAQMKPVLLLVYLNYILCFMWNIGINVSTSLLFGTPVKFGGYGYTDKQIGYLYFIPMVGVLIGEVIGHYSNDALTNRYIKRHKGVFEPEVRLLIVYPAILFMVVGLIILGFGLQFHLNVASIIIGWGTYVVGIMIFSVIVLAYAVDAYPSVPAETCGFVSFLRVLGGFAVGYFQQPWGDKVGFQVSFGTQAAVAGASIVITIALSKFGHRMRAKYGGIA